MSGEKTEDPGDDKAIVRAYLCWVNSTGEVLGAKSEAPPLCHVQREGNRWQLAFSILRGTRRQRHFAYVSPSIEDGTWPLTKLGDHAWDIMVSIHVHGQIHGFFTLVNVPSPAPWEAL